MFGWLRSLFAPRVELVVRNIGTKTKWELPKHPHEATSWRTIRCRHIPRVGELMEIAEGVTLVVREVTYRLHNSQVPEILCDFATRYPVTGHEMQKLGFNFYHHNGAPSCLRPSRLDSFVIA
jgi:hypothetical protein